MNGTLVYVVGASGAGKDSLLAFAEHFFHKQVVKQDETSEEQSTIPVFVRRYITRPQNAGGEAHLAISQEEFAQMLEQGKFVFHWQSHGLYYGISKASFAGLAQGKVVVMNGSRSYLPKALEIVPELMVVEVVVSFEILQARLLQRGREVGADLEERLQKAKVDLPSLKRYICIDNSSALELAGARFIELLQGLWPASAR